MSKFTNQREAFPMPEGEHKDISKKYVNRSQGNPVQPQPNNSIPRKQPVKPAQPRPVQPVKPVQPRPVQPKPVSSTQEIHNVVAQASKEVKQNNATPGQDNLVTNSGVQNILAKKLGLNPEEVNSGKTYDDSETAVLYYQENSGMDDGFEDLDEESEEAFVRELEENRKKHNLLAGKKTAPIKPKRQPMKPVPTQTANQPVNKYKPSHSSFDLQEDSNQPTKSKAKMGGKTLFGLDLKYVIIAVGILLALWLLI